jgi:hypothetical protein
MQSLHCEVVTTIWSKATTGDEHKGRAWWGGLRVGWQPAQPTPAVPPLGTGSHSGDDKRQRDKETQDRAAHRLTVEACVPASVGAGQVGGGGGADL